MLLLASCIFDSDGDSLVAWLDDQGFPSNYLVQTVEIDDISLDSYSVGFDSTPRINYYQGVAGEINGMKHEWILDFGFRDRISVYRRLLLPWRRFPRVLFPRALGGL